MRSTMIDTSHVTAKPGASSEDQLKTIMRMFRNLHFFQSIIDQVPVGILITKPPGSRILFMNAEASRLFGIAAIHPGSETDFREVFFDQGGKCFFSTEDLLKGDNFIKQRSSNQFYAARCFEVQVRQPGGNKRHISISSSPVLDQENRTLAVISLFNDISAKKEAEITSQRDRQRLEYALVASVDGFWEWNIPNDHGYLSPRYHEIYGYEVGELPPNIEFWYSQLHPDDLEVTWKNLKAFLQSGNDHYTATYRMLTKSGTYRWIMSKAIVTQRTEDGKVEIMVGTHQDISKQVELENTLKKTNHNLEDEILRQTRNLNEANQQLETILNNSSESIWVTDGKGVILRANKAASETIGMDADVFVGRKMVSLVEDGYIDCCITVEVLSQKKQIVRMQKVLLTDRDLLVTGTPVFDDAGNIKLVIINEADLTNLKKLEREIEDARIKTERFQEALNQISMLELKEQNIIARSKKMKQVIVMALKLARMDVSNILILGDSGTGKSLIAKFIHNNGPRKGGPFLQINCAALPETLLEAELFGYEKGAFTGAQAGGKIGLMELAQEGTLFLDEIGELSLNVQAKILKCIEEKEIMRIGGLEIIKINCNVIAATNVDLLEKSKKKEFREDLFYRLNIFTINLPPLRDRSDDILDLSLFFLDKYNQKYNQNKKITPRCLERMKMYEFPGNIRELQNRIQKAVVISDSDTIDDLIDLDRNDLFPKTDGFNDCIELSIKPGGLKAMLLEVEKKVLIEAAGEKCTSRELANLLMTSQSTIMRRLRRHGLTHILQNG